MNMYSEKKNHFENEYRKYIDNYVSCRVTVNEMQILKNIKAQKNLHISDMHNVIIQNRYPDSQAGSSKSAIS